MSCNVRSNRRLEALLVGLAAGWLGCGGDGTRARAAGTQTTGSAALDRPPIVDENTVNESTVDENGDLLVDDLTDGDSRFAADGITGEWFTYSDGTGELVPPDHTGLPSTGGEAHVTGRGFSDWGAGVSAYFRSTDLSRFESLQIRARGAGAILVELATPATSPPNEGGTCMGGGCFGHFAMTIELAEEYQDFELPFAALAQPTWAQPAELSLAGVISVNLVAKVVGGSASMDLWLDRFALHAVEGL
jgi:hypothetical protein